MHQTPSYSFLSNPDHSSLSTGTGKGIEGTSNISRYQYCIFNPKMSKKFQGCYYKISLSFHDRFLVLVASSHLQSYCELVKPQGNLSRMLAEAFDGRGPLYRYKTRGIKRPSVWSLLSKIKDASYFILFQSSCFSGTETLLNKNLCLHSASAVP